MIYWQAFFYISANHNKFGLVFLESLSVEYIIFSRNNMICKFSIKQIARSDKRVKSCIALVLAETHIISYSPARLPRLVVTAKGSPSRNTYYSVYLNTMLHHHVNDASRKKSAHGTALKYKSRFHIFI